MSNIVSACFGCNTKRVSFRHVFKLEHSCTSARDAAAGKRDVQGNETARFSLGREGALS